MPTYEFACSICEIIFEELLLSTDEIKNYRDSHPCPSCGEAAVRSPVVAVNFAFKAPGGQTQGLGVHGQSGVHDLDYPALDKAVGRSSAVKWQKYDERKTERDKIRKKLGTNSISVSSDGEIRPADGALMNLREKAITTFKTVKKKAEESR